jgi:uncharacterized membrane protein
MTFDPLLQAPLAVQAHVATVLAALVCGGWLIFVSRKGSPAHRMLGMTFLGLMTATALVSFLIHRRTPDSPVFGLSYIHLLAAFVLFAAWRALDGARKGNIKQHREWTRGLYFGALVITGATNVFLFSGITHDVFFSR